MHSEVSSPDSMIESAVDRHVVAVVGEGLQKPGHFVAPARRLGKKAVLLIAEQVPDRDEPLRTSTRSLRRGNGSAGSHRVREKGGKTRQGKTGADRLKDKTSPINKPIYQPRLPAQANRGSV